MNGAKRRALPGKVKTARRAFTLTELSVSMGITGVLMLGLASSLKVATLALPDNDRPNEKVLDTSRVLRDLAEEMRTAIHIVEKTSTAVTFTVADRDNDGSPETVRYAWSGTTGDALTRTLNHGAAAAVLPDVHRFQLTYNLEKKTESYPGPLQESIEQELSSYQGGSYFTWYLSSDWQQVGQYFNPSLPADAVSYRVTRVSMPLSYHGTPLSMSSLRLTTADENGLPSDTTLASQNIPEISLSDSLSWENYTFANAPSVDAGDGMCFVLSWESGGRSANYVYAQSGGADYFWTLEDENGSRASEWGRSDSRSMWHTVYGKYIAPGPDQTATRAFVTTTGIELQAGGDAGTRLHTAVQMLNTPEVLSAVWELDFETEPTALDMNGDDQADWALRGGGSIAVDDLVKSAFVMDGNSNVDLDARPDNDFAELVTIDLRYRCTEAANGGVYFWINSDYAGTTFAPVLATLDMQDDFTQTLRFAVGGATVATVSELPDDFVSVRILIDPDLDLVNLRVQNVDEGTYAYTPRLPAGDPKRATLNHWGSAGQWDLVRIRVGGNN